MLVAMVGQKGIPASIGGVERYVEELAAQLPKYGIESLVYTRPWYVAARADYKPPPGVRTVKLPTIPTKHLDTISHVLACVADLAEQHEVDVVHVHCIGPALVAPALRLLRLPVVVTVQGLDWRREKWGAVARRTLRAGEWLASRFAQRLVVVSPALVQYFEEHYGIRPLYVPNAARAFPYRPPNRIRQLGLEPRKFVLSCARLVPEKGVHLLIEAFRAAPSGWKLAVAGSSLYDARYERSLRAAADERVVFTGAAGPELLAELYHHAALFVLPSMIEGMSLALLEAMQHGLPCLVSDIPENAAVIAHPLGQFRAGSSVDLERSLLQLLRDEQARRELAQYARREAPRYTWDAVAESMARIYREVAVEAGRVSEAAAVPVG